MLIRAFRPLFKSQHDLLFRWKETNSQFYMVQYCRCCYYLESTWYLVQFFERAIWKRKVIYWYCNNSFVLFQVFCFSHPYVTRHCSALNMSFSNLSINHWFRCKVRFVLLPWKIHKIHGGVQCSPLCISFVFSAKWVTIDQNNELARRRQIPDFPSKSRVPRDSRASFLGYAMLMMLFSTIFCGSTWVYYYQH